MMKNCTGGSRADGKYADIQWWVVSRCVRDGDNETPPGADAGVSGQHGGRQAADGGAAQWQQAHL